MVTKRKHAGRKKASPRRGKGFLDFLGKANDFLKNSGAISGLTGMAANSGLIKDPRALAILGGVSNVSGSLGYGRVHRGHGSLQC